MKLNKLVNTSADIEIKGITNDSREVSSGFLFGAVPDTTYVADAVSKGAVAIIVPQDYEGDAKGVEFIRSENPSYTYAQAVAKYYGKTPEHLAAVTGTNGKTSIADFVRQVLTMMGYKAASIGTLGLIVGNEEPIPSPNTTPNNVALHRELKKIADDGVNYAILEASSHGLHQNRLGGLTFEVAGFTNLTRDHLDYHKTFENYLDAKLILFRQNLKQGGTAVLNADIDVYGKIAAVCEQRGQKIISYGVGGQDIKLLNSEALPHGQRLDIEYFGQQKSRRV